MTGKVFLCVGRVYADLVFRSDQLPAWGRELFCDGFQASAGGGAFITAAYLSALGHRVYVAGVAGAAQPFGQVIAGDLARFGLNGDHLRLAETPQVTVAIAGAEDRAFLTQRADAPVAVPALAAFDHLHIGELETLHECPGLIDHARRAGASVSADCGDQAQFSPDSADLLARLDVFMPSQSEVAALTAAGVALDAVPVLVEKQGANGARARGRAGWIQVPAKAGAVVDTTGAGDAFNAGFLHVWTADGALEQALDMGTRFGAAAVAHLGGATGAKALADAGATV